MANIKIKLSQKDVKDAIEKLKITKQIITTLDDDIKKELAENTRDQIAKNYATKGFSSNSKPTIGIAKYGKGYKAFIRGKEVIYEEFGTGDVGARNGHPWKGDYGLNPYNSGETIRPADEESENKYGISSGLYWTYYDEVKHRMIATQGIPAGLFMYESSMWLRNNYKRIVKKKVDDALSKL